MRLTINYGQLTTHNRLYNSIHDNSHLISKKQKTQRLGWV
ncbi:hypothetical protein FQV37_205 [Psychrobacter nivimaris]|uniref:Uncharacterized protein n=1 Tax=Psychrobacter nivimaris TaxID=281738 RepID=A0A6N7BZG8_9GAMM|nr:hypothetical protein FQV37_205 [Psychrobacter nivimaris]